MKRNLFLVMLLGLKLTSLLASDIPAYRKYQWNQAGAETIRLENLPTLDMGSFGCDARGILSNNEAFEKALAALGNKGGVLQFRGGIYLFTDYISIPSNVIVKGNGASTELVFDLETEQHAIRFEGTDRVQNVQLVENVKKGSNTVALGEGHGLQTGDYLKLTIKDSRLAFSDWSKNHIGQIVQVASVKENTIKLTTEIRIHLAKKVTEVRVIDPVVNAGIQCLTLVRNDQTESLKSNIRFQNAANCFVRNISSSYSNFAHVELSMSSHITVEGCRFEKAHQYGEGGQGYGVVLQYTSGDNLIQNNVFETLRHSILLQAGANGNVIAYNFSTLPTWDQPGLPTNSAGDIVLHGNYPFANLFEGNVVQNIVADDSHGKNGYHNTFYRNEVDLYGLFANPNAIDSMSVAGNQINNRTFLHGNYRLSGMGHYENYNVVKGDVKPSGSTQLTENSLYLSETPEFVTNAPGKTEVYRIQAETRYHAKSPLLCRAPDTEEDKEETKDTTNTSVNILSEETWSVYPNPASTQIQIEGAVGMRLSLTHLNGSTVLYTEGSTTLSVGHLPRGMYLLRMMDQDGRSTYKKLLLN